MDELRRGAGPPAMSGRSWNRCARLCRSAVPQAEEGIGYRIPAYRLCGKPMLYFAGFRGHVFAVRRIGHVFCDARRRTQRICGERREPWGFPLDQPVPVKLIRRIAKLRAAGIVAAAKQAR